MCMMIYHPEGARPFTKAEFLDFNRRNPHGFGVIWRAPTGTVRSKKGLLDVGAQWTIYQSLLKTGCSEMVLHWRMRTAGPLSDEMCHPFKAAGRVLVMHNGVLDHRSTKDKSDTVCFIEDVINPILKSGKDAFYDRRVMGWLDQEIGPGNKLVLWKQGDPSPVIVGEKKGIWWQSRWYSNQYAWTVPKEAWYGGGIEE